MSELISRILVPAEETQGPVVQEEPTETENHRGSLKSDESDDEEGSSESGVSSESASTSTETLCSDEPPPEHTRRESLAMQELKEYLDRISRRRTGLGIDPYVQRVQAPPPRRTLLRNRVLEKPPAAMQGSLSQLLLQAGGLSRDDLLLVLREVADLLRRFVGAAASRVYLVEEDRLVLHCHEGLLQPAADAPTELAVAVGASAAGFAAASGDFALQEAHLERRFPQGVPWAAPGTVGSAVAVPLCDDHQQQRCCAVIEIAQAASADNQFGWPEVTAAVCMASCVGGALGLGGARVSAQTRAELQTELMALALRFFRGDCNLLLTLSRLLHTLRQQLGAARAVLFLLDPDDASLAHLFRESLQPPAEGNEDVELVLRDAKVSLPDEAPAVWRAATSLCPVSLSSMECREPSDTFNRHLLAGPSVRAGALCLPLAGRDGDGQPAVAVVLLADKLKPRPSSQPCVGAPELDPSGFSSEVAARWLSDSGAAPLCALLACLGLRAVGPASLLRPRRAVLRDALRHAMRPPAALVRALMHRRPLPAAFQEFSWAPPSPEHFDDTAAALLVLSAAEDLLGGENVLGPREAWAELVLTVCGCHRDVPFHNFRQAVTVLQTVYAILKRNEFVFTTLELQGLFLAALCIHVDHRGLTQNFLTSTGHPLADFLPSAKQHNHHFEVAKMILERLPVFPKTDRDLLLEEVRDAMLASDLVAYFRHRRRLLQLLRVNEFIWNDPAHRRLFKGVLVTTATSSVLCRPAPENARAADLLAEEMFMQGDLERQLGLEPLPVMDREQALGGCLAAAADAAAFVEAVAAPAAELLTLILPNTRGLHKMATSTARHWRAVAEGRRRRSTDVDRGRRSTDAGRGHHSRERDSLW